LANVKRLSYTVPSHCDVLHKAVFDTGSAVLSLNGKVCHKLLNPEATYEYLSGLDTVFIVGPYLVAYAIHTPWYSTDEVLCDLIVMRITNDPGKLSDVTDFLEAEARRENVSWVAVGTLLSPNDALLRRGYERCGYEVAATQLVKELT